PINHLFITEAVLPTQLLATVASYLPADEAFDIASAFSLNPPAVLTEAFFDRRNDLDLYASESIKNAITDDDDIAFPEKLNPLKHKIQKLDLGRRNGDYRCSTSKIQKIIDNLPSLTGLILKGADVSDEMIAVVLSRFPKLTALCLH